MTPLGSGRSRFESRPHERAVRAAPPPPDTLRALFDPTDEDESPTSVAQFDVLAYARATAKSEPEVHGAGDWSPDSGVRRSFPTLSGEVGALPNEPEEDALLRWLGGGDRELRIFLSPRDIAALSLDPEHGYLLGLLDGVTSITDVLDISALPRVLTLRAIEEIVLLGIAG